MSKKPGIRERERHAKFMSKTRSVYRHMEQRCGKLAFDIEYLRSWIEAEIKKNCRYCSTPLNVKNFSIDHRMPISRGGISHSHNLRVVCKGCNTAKGNMSEEEFSDFVEHLTKFYPPEIKTDVLMRMKAGASIVRLRFLGRKRA